MRRGPHQGKYHYSSLLSPELRVIEIEARKTQERGAKSLEFQAKMTLESTLARPDMSRIFKPLVKRAEM